MSRRSSPLPAVALIALVTSLGSGAAQARVVSPVAPADGAPVLVLADPAASFGAPALSYSGRYLSHLETRSVAPEQQVRRVDLTQGSSELLSPSLSGAPATGNYSRPAPISGDGTRTAFTSSGSTLVAGDTNGRFDAFVRDTATHTTIVASVAFDGSPANGDSGMVSLSKGGRYAVFTSSATNVVPGSTTTNADVYRRDLRTGTTVQVTVRADGSPSRGPGSSSADISANGRLVAFNSYDTDLVRADRSPDGDVFVRNLATGRTRLISAGVPADANPTGVVISPDGGWVSARWNDGSLHLTDVASGATQTVATEGYALTGAFSTALDRFVYISGGVPYVRDLGTGVSTPIAVPGDGSVAAVSISGNGLVAAFDWNPAGGGPTQIYTIAL